MPHPLLSLRWLALILCALQAVCATPGGAARHSEDIADIDSHAWSRGLFAGIALDGSDARRLPMAVEALSP